jgi:hypothetical protein
MAKLIAKIATLAALKSGRHDITEILLKVVLNTITNHHHPSLIIWVFYK